MASGKKAKDKTAAIITIHAPGKMTKRGRREIAVWLRRHASMLLKHGDKYIEGRFTGRYIYT